MLHFVTLFHRCLLVKTHSEDQDVILNISPAFVKTCVVALVGSSTVEVNCLKTLISKDEGVVHVETMASIFRDDIDIYQHILFYSAVLCFIM